MELILDNIYKNYGRKSVLKGASAKIENGVYGLLGPNGAGKTTLIRILSGAMPATSGDVFLNGKNKSDLGDDYRRNIGFLPQELGIYPELSGRRYLYFIAALKGLTGKTAERRIHELASAVGIQDYLDLRCGKYSSGMKRRLGIAQALLNEPKILILDEPTAGLDPEERIRLRNLISDFSKDKIVILSTHIVSDLDRIARKIFMIENGRIDRQSTPDEYLTQMAGKVWVAEVPTGDPASVLPKMIISNVIPKDKMMQVHIINDNKPLDNAQPCEPTLEDAYLYIFSGKQGKVE